MKNNYSFTFVTHRLAGGGAERVVTVLSSALARLGYKTHIFVYYKSENEYPVDPDVDVFYYESAEKKKNIVEKLKKLLCLRKKIKEWDTIFLIPFDDEFAVHSFLATLFLKLKFICTVRVNPVMRVSRYSKLFDLIANGCFALYAQTEEEKKFFNQRIQNKTFILPNPVNYDAINAVHIYREKLNKIVSVGRLTNQKNYPMLISAVDKIAERYPNLIVEIYGEGELKNDLQKQISAKGLDDKVELMGYEKDVINKVNDADIFVLTSNFEGMPNALMEAMTIGLPSISTDCPSGPSELICDELDGILIPMNDEKALADNLIRLIDNPVYAEKMGKMAKEKMIRNYSPEIIASRFANELIERYEKETIL